MKRLFAVCISAAVLFSLSACAQTTPQATQAQTQAFAGTDASYPEVYDKLDLETFQAFPIASDDMTVDELRDLCVNFFRFTKSFAWTPSEDLAYVRNRKGTEDAISYGKIYGGLPYIGLGSGNIYRFLDFYDLETGVLDVSDVKEDIYLFGSQCSLGAYWGWGRVINSAQYDWTYNMVQSKGFIRVGAYTYDDTILSFSSDLTTEMICANNGEQVMYESYACLLPGDGLVYSTVSGHVIMCSAAPVVVRNEDGTINADESYIRIIDQSQSWKDLEQSNGDGYSVKAGIDVKRTFSYLFEKHYLPFTFAEFHETDPVEDLTCLFSYTGSELSVLRLKQVIITANYGISDIYVSVKNEGGEVVQTAEKRMETASVMHTYLDDAIDETVFLPYADGKHSVEVIAQFANGERKVLYSGILNGLG